MTIDFHDPKNRNTYATRTADSSWAEAIRPWVNPANLRVADIGCGGGIYSLAFLDLGAQSVAGVDFSETMVSAAREHAADRPGVHFSVGQAASTGLPSGAFDLVFERALIHHLADYGACFSEARRLLAAGGALLIQDRMLEDVGQPASPSHLRGYYFECFPRLLDIETRRRPDAKKVEDALRAAGFQDIRSKAVWELRRTYPTFAEYAEELAARTGRSILHELSDDEIRHLIDHVGARVPAGEPLAERDRWTLWFAKQR